MCAHSYYYLIYQVSKYPIILLYAKNPLNISTWLLIKMKGP